MKIAIGNDHAGTDYKFAIVEFSSVEESNRLLKLNHIDILKISLKSFR